VNTLIKEAKKEGRWLEWLAQWKAVVIFLSCTLQILVVSCIHLFVAGNWIGQLCPAFSGMKLNCCEDHKQETLAFDHLG